MWYLILFLTNPDHVIDKSIYIIRTLLQTIQLVFIPNQRDGKNKGISFFNGFDEFRFSKAQKYKLHTFLDFFYNHYKLFSWYQVFLRNNIISIFKIFCYNKKKLICNLLSCTFSDVSNNYKIFFISRHIYCIILSAKQLHIIIICEYQLLVPL